jgi:hypothetical protein
MDKSDVKLELEKFRIELARFENRLVSNIAFISMAVVSVILSLLIILK